MWKKTEKYFFNCRRHKTSVTERECDGERYGNFSMVVVGVTMIKSKKLEKSFLALGLLQFSGI